MDIASLAKANAISLEVKKDGLTQRQSGDWQLRLTIGAIDMDQRITSAPMGTRFACVLVEINDDESPRDHTAEQRDKWRDLGPTTQAGIRCTDPVFWAWLEEERHYSVANSNDAAEAVRDICGVASRRDFEKPGKHIERLRWYALDDAFRGWKAKENA
jgi:hypothetical protein